MSDSIRTSLSASKRGPLVIKLGGAAAEAPEELDDLYGAIVHLRSEALVDSRLVCMAPRTPPAPV